jgi:type II secretory pathway pseudopilin PulG
MRAFTLTEALIAFFILSLLAGGIFMVTNIAILSWNSNRAMLEVVQEVRQAMDGMTREIRQSNSPPGSESPEFEFSIPDVTNKIKYYCDNDKKQLIREHPPGTKRVLANNISFLNFTPTASVLKIQIRATKTIRNVPHYFSLTEEVKLRNG